MGPGVENKPMNATANISIRPANPDDYSALWQLAALDDRPLHSGPFLLAETEGDVVAAISLPTGSTVADPFRRTAEATALLQLRASQLRVVAA